MTHVGKYWEEVYECGKWCWSCCCCTREHL